MLNTKTGKLVFLIVVALLFLITVLYTGGTAKDVSLYRDCFNLPVIGSPVLEFLGPEDEVSKLFRIVGFYIPVDVTSYQSILDSLTI
jgi:hypothetical protein